MLHSLWLKINAGRYCVATPEIDSQVCDLGGNMEFHASVSFSHKQTGLSTHGPLMNVHTTWKGRRVVELGPCVCHRELIRHTPRDECVWDFRVQAHVYILLYF